MTGIEVVTDWSGHLAAGRPLENWPDGFGEIATQAAFGDTEFHSTTFRRHSLTTAARQFNSTQRSG